MNASFLCRTIVCLALLGASASGWAQNLQQVIQGMQSRWSRIRDASAVVELQTWDKSQGEEVSVFYGQVYYLHPDRIRLEYSPAVENATEPALYPLGQHKYVYLHDGRSLWRYTHSRKTWLNQAGNDPVISMVNQIADINNFNVNRFLDIYQVADVKSDRTHGFTTYLLRAEPKRRGGPHPRQLLWIDGRSETRYLPVDAVMASEGQEVSCFFHKIEPNPGLPREIFSTGPGE